MNDLTTSLAQLRHLYAQMMGGHVKDCAQAARGLLGPEIARLEAMNAPVTVKPLVWVSRGYRHIVAIPFGMEFTIAAHLHNGEWNLVIGHPMGSRVIKGGWTSLEETQAAAQQLWETFIRDAITISP